MVEIKRTYDNGTETIGEMLKDNEHLCYTLELPWKDNQHNISCIPTGTYTVVKRTSPKHGVHFHITNVPNRSYILIHVANYVSDLRGCVAPGASLTDLNGDGEIDVTSSKNTLKNLLNELPDEFELKIS